MNKLDKFLSKLDKKTRAVIKEAILLILNKDLSTLDIKKLKGESNIYRVRVGKARIIFEHTETGNKIRRVSFRSDHTY